MARFGFTPVVPPFAGAGQTEEIVAGYMAKLEALGGVRRDVSEHADGAPLVLVVATGGSEGTARQLYEQRQMHVPGEPVIIVAHPGNNSLPASLETLARLQQDGARGKICYLRGVDDDAGFAALERTIDDVAVWNALHSARIGLVGDPSGWLVASSPDPAVVTDTWGPEVVPISIEELEVDITSALGADVRAGAESLGSGAHSCGEPTETDLTRVSQIYAGLKELVARNELTAVTVRCFDLLFSRETSGCFALSQLTDEGIISGCEGDLVSTVGLLWAKLLTGETPWMANPSDIDVAENSVLLAHCTVPRSIVEEYGLRSHFESGIGIGIQGTLPKGPVTLLRIGGTMMNELWLAEGDLVATGNAENLCRTQAHIKITDGDVADLLSHPLGNHIVMIRGHHANHLAEWWDTML